MAQATNPFEPTSNETPMTPIPQKSSPARATSTLTLPLANMEPISATTTITGTPSETPGSTHPFSAFYSHPQCAVSCEQKGTSLQKDSTTSFDQDLEKGIITCPAKTLGSELTPQASGRPSFEPSLTTTQTTTSLATPTKTRTSCGKDGIYVSVWPAGSEIRQRKKDARRMKGCILFRNLSRKQKIFAKICIAILILGIATVIGCVISYKTGGLVWKSANNYGAIGS